jgi:hypothetical protein
MKYLNKLLVKHFKEAFYYRIAKKICFWSDKIMVSQMFVKGK